MSAQIVAVLSVGIALGLFIWRSTDRLDRRMDVLAGDFSGLRGEFHGRFGAEPAAEPP